MRKRSPVMAGVEVSEGPDPVRGIDLGAYVFLALMVVITSSTAPAAKFAVRELPVGALPLVRFGVAGLCLWPVVAAGSVAADAPGRPWAARPDGFALRADQPDLLPERGAPDADLACRR